VFRLVVAGLGQSLDVHVPGNCHDQTDHASKKGAVAQRFHLGRHLPHQRRPDDVLVSRKKRTKGGKFSSQRQEVMRKVLVGKERITKGSNGAILTKDKTHRRGKKARTSRHRKEIVNTSTDKEKKHPIQNSSDRVKSLRTNIEDP